MSRFNAILLLAFASMVVPVFSADPTEGTTSPDRPRIVDPLVAPDDIDPETGLSRSSVVRPLRDFPAPPDPRGLAREPGRPGPAPRGPAISLEGRPHVALILPTASPALGRLAEAVRAGFVASAEAAGAETVPVAFIAVDNEGPALVEACRHAQRAGAVLVVGGLTRDGATALAASDCPRQPVLALNEPQGFAALPGSDPRLADLPRNLYHVSLSLENEARQAALLAVADGWRSAIVIASASPLARRVREAFEREWDRAAGEIRRVPFGGNPDDAPAIRDRIATIPADMVFLALEQAEARAVRPYVSGMLPIYATSMSVDPRAEPTVNVDLQGVRYMEMPWFVQPDHPAVMVYPLPRGALSVEQERLYALGIDAYRLALALLRPGAEPPAVDGVTGRITLAPGNAFVRALTPSEVDGGRVVPASGAAVPLR